MVFIIDHIRHLMIKPKMLFFSYHSDQKIYIVRHLANYVGLHLLYV